MFEHLDDDSTPRPPDGGADAARRAARYRTHRRTGITATTFLLIGAVLMVAVRSTSPETVQVQQAGVASGPNDQVTRNSTTTTLAATVTTDSGGTPGQQPRSTPGDSSEQPGSTNNPGVTPGLGTSPGGDDLPRPDDPTTPTTVDGDVEPGGLQFLATPDVHSSLTGTNEYVTVNLEVRNPTGTDFSDPSVNLCDPVRRLFVDTDAMTLTPDYENCEGQGGAEGISAPAHGEPWRWSQRVRVMRASGGLVPTGTYTLWLYSHFHVELTITGSAQ
jgi:hypothetical protein